MRSNVQTASDPQEIKEFEVGCIIGAYRVVAKVGRGGFGAVALVRHIQAANNSDPIAMKYCLRREPELRRRFAREVRAQTRVNHPNVVEILYEDLENDPPFFLMPVAKHALTDELAILAQDNVKAIEAMLEVCDGVTAIHEQGTTHRDLKPDNILRMPDDKLAITDFGLAKIDPRDSTVLTRTAVVLGTDGYIAPEQRTYGGTRDSDERADVFALGATFYQVLTGRDPIMIDLRGVHPALARIIRRATAAVPDDRYQSVPELAEQLKRYLASMKTPREPIDYFDELLDGINTRVARGEILHPDQITNLLGAVRPILEVNAMTVLDRFDEIPDGLITEAAEFFTLQLVDAVEAYAEACDQAAGAHQFAWAERVARRMRMIFNRTHVTMLRATAWRAALIAAVDLNRYAAMQSVGNMLTQVQDDAEAAAIAAIVVEEESRINSLRPYFDVGRLHRDIRAAVRAAIRTEG